ncbi:MAG: M60 family peptidase N-terminal accessory domain-containing protein, partial [Bacteroidota bacterium]
MADYNFNANADDQLSNYDPATIFGTLDFSSGEYVQLDSGEYIVLPNTLNNAFDKTESLEINVRFKVEGDWRSTPALDGFGEEARIILTTKDEYDQRFGGFDITAREWENDLWITTTFGDDINYSFGLTEGKRDFVAQIDSDIWYDLSVKFVFDNQQPYIQYIVNGTATFSYYPSQEENQFAMNYEGFRQTIDQRQIIIGSTLNNNIAERDADHPSLDLKIDYLTIYSPAKPGNPTQIADVLQNLIDYMNADISLTDDQLDSLQSVFSANWDDNSYDANSSLVQQYMTTYSNTNGFVFTLKFNAEDPVNFLPLKAIQFQLQQWIIDNKYSVATTSEMEGLIFKEHENFPGTVSDGATRVTGATFTIDGDYQTDPGFYLNDQEYVRRPTGFYAPPGELISLTVPDAIIGQGLTVYVGAHRKNLQETWNELRRFPRVSTQFPLDSKTVDIINPFGGGIYIAIPDGNQFGALTFEIDGAVKAPYYSTKPGFTTDRSEFLAEVQKKEVPWADMESANFMTTIPNGMATSINDPDSVFYFWDKSFDAINIALGRSKERFRGEYLLVDRQSHVKFTAAPAAYPMS